MGNRAKDLAERIRMFNDEVISFVKNCTDEDWRKVCNWEAWSVGVVARHIGAAHYEAVELAKMIVKGAKLPELSRDQITERANLHAREHAGCTKGEVLDILQRNGNSVVEFVTGMDDTQLDLKGYFAAAQSEMSAQKFIENVILRSGGEHFSNMKAATSP